MDQRLFLLHFSCVLEYSRMEPQAVRTELFIDPARGMPDAFDATRADFSGMTGQRELWIDAVIHQALVEVSEEGTQASAATAVVIKKGGPPIPAFNAAHPFLYLIRDKQTGAIVFLGRVVNPKG